MKKSLLSIGLGLGLAINSYGGQAAITVNAGTMTNLFSFTGNYGSVLVKQVIAGAASGSVPQLISLVDTPTNLLVYTTLAYSNKISYATNYPVVYTNFYNVVQSNNWYQASGQAVISTNYYLVDVTNSVPQQTNNYPVRFSVALPTNQVPLVFGPVNQYYDQGIWITNSAANGSAVVTITW